MDPTQCLHRIEDAVLDGDYEEADEACEDLYEWLERGGYEPTWVNSTAGARYYRQWQNRRLRGAKPMNNAKNAHSGTVSAGTMRNEDLIPCFCAYLRAHSEELTSLEFDGIVAIEQDVEDGDSAYYANHKQANADLEALFEALNGLAPEGYYFGSHPGDGSDFGFWEYEDN